MPQPHRFTNSACCIKSASKNPKSGNQHNIRAAGQRQRTGTRCGNAHSELLVGISLSLLVDSEVTCLLLKRLWDPVWTEGCCLGFCGVLSVYNVVADAFSSLGVGVGGLAFVC
jgi:hypothetical protein